MTRLAVFASGSGTNAQKIFEYFQNHTQIKVAGLFTNKAGAGVIERAQKFEVPVHVFTKEQFKQGELAALLQQQGIDFIVLAGFLWLMPPAIVQRYSGKMVNIHPALLPQYGGKGMYGHHVHQAVVAAGEKESGITIHFVNEVYDEGQIIFQARVALAAHDTPQSLANKIHALEHQHYARVIEEVITK